MCNAFNHPLHCNCGWGGVWYGSTGDSATWLFNRPLHHPRKLGRQNGTYQAISRGYTRPNSTCPVCGQAVYFYASPYGGRVFFDELGPPWPKHPCTDNAGARQPQEAAATTRSSRDSLLWLGDVQLAKVGPSTYEMQGVSQDKKFIFHFEASGTVMAEMVRFKPLGQGKLEVHILDYNDETRSWMAWQGTARVKRESVGSARQLKASIVHQHGQSTLVAARAAGARYQREAPGQFKLSALQQRGSAAPKALHITSDGLYLCPICGAHLAQGRVLKHLFEVHKVQASELSALPTIPAAELSRPVRCPDCANMMPLQGLAKHRRRKHGVTG